MSSWGYTDNAAIAGTVTHYSANVNVVGSSTYFSVNVKDGDYLYLSGNKYQVANVASNTALYLTSVTASGASGVTAYLQQGPKFLSNLNGNYSIYAGNTRTSNIVNIRNVYGVTLEEMFSNVANGASISQAGVAYFANVTANTYANVFTTGVIQPISNANVTLNFTNNALASITISQPGQGYNAAIIANTFLGIYTTGARQPTTNATANLTFTSADTSKTNAHHTGWVTFNTYTDAFGATRIKTEVLAAMSKNFTASVAGDNDPDDTIFPH
ncbi:hypothetical protein UFOVP242_68 [uncultured Caudovirales phage]|uniref:Uncharacterized protein n=1 Tax=uncultured Caudovirales phage TaxID=2100421 RepID=A0A6J7WY13_9CAUD|nr:hypothetical protein UFOVP242_68 [uncultured Caudovirales phage]